LASFNHLGIGTAQSTSQVVIHIGPTELAAICIPQNYAYTNNAWAVDPAHGLLPCFGVGVIGKTYPSGTEVYEEKEGLGTSIIPIVVTTYGAFESGEITTISAGNSTSYATVVSTGLGQAIMKVIPVD